MTADATSRYDVAIDMIRHQEYGVAIQCLENNLKGEEKDPASLSLLGVALARSGRDLKRAAKLCTEAIELDKEKALYYFYLADVYRRMRRKRKVLEVLKAGLKVDPGNRQLVKLLNQFGSRKKPAFSFLKRSNPINKYAGRLMAGHGSR